MLPLNSLPLWQFLICDAIFTEALQRLESVFVESIQNAHEEKDKVQNTVYLNEIGNLKKEKEMMKAEHGKEINYLKKQHELEEGKLKEELGRMKKENESSKQSQQRFQGQYDKTKKEYESLLQAHTKLKTSHQLETEQLNKTTEKFRTQFDMERKKYEEKADESHRQKNDITNLRADIENMEEMSRKHRQEIEKAHDEIIALKTTIGAAQSDIGDFREVPQKTESAHPKTPDRAPDKIYFKGANDPLSNMYHVKEGLRIFTHVFYYSETAYQWRKAVYSDDFAAAEEILNSADGYEAKAIADSKIQVREGWEDIKEEVMSEILDEKFKKCREYRNALWKSQKADLIENTSDRFWARGTNDEPGQNKLGQLHMKKREKCDEHLMANDVENSKQATRTSKTANVLVLGNSHTSNNFRLPHLNREIDLEKKPAMTIGHARKELEQEKEKRNVIVLHELTNDIGRNENEALKSSNDFIEVVKLASTKAEKVVVSLGLPRNDDDEKHQMTQMINWNLRNRLKGQPNIVVCEHDNMLHFGKPNLRYLARDQYHLSTMGKVVFAKNLSRSIHMATGLPSPNRQTTSYPNGQYRQESNPNGQNKQGNGQFWQENNYGGNQYGQQMNGYQYGGGQMPWGYEGTKFFQ